MRFHDREYEMEELNRVWKLSLKSTHLTVITGRRRVGKTELVKQFSKDKEYLYFFIGRKNMSLLLEELSSITATKIRHAPTFIEFDEFLKFLLNNLKPGTIIFFDEFQNFKYVDKTVFSDFQKIFDEYKNRTKVYVIVAGSHISLMNRIFSGEKEPLFGRATEKYTLKPLPFRMVSKILSELGIDKKDEQVRWYSVFGGMPKYYVVAEEQGLKGQDIFTALKLLLFRDFAPMADEVRNVLTEEFGSEHPTYFSILESVALGNHEMSAIADRSGINIKSISKYLGLLVKDFEYLDYAVPITERHPWKSKKGRYFLNNNFFSFYFKYVYRNRSYYEIGDYDILMEKIKKDFNVFTGMVFEKISREFIVEKRAMLPFQFEKIGRQWGKFRGEKGKNTYEIDLVALNEGTKEIMFCECKWKDVTAREAEDILDWLKIKSRYVPWNSGERKEHFGIIARKIRGKAGLRRKGYLVFDLGDF